MSEIPPEAQVAIEEFNREETARQAARASGEKGKKKKSSGAELKTATAEEVIHLAQAEGWELETGGKHPKLVRGKRNVAIPVHGGSGRNLATGTLRQILKIIEDTP